MRKQIWRTIVDLAVTVWERGTRESVEYSVAETITSSKEACRLLRNTIRLLTRENKNIVAEMESIKEQVELAKKKWDEEILVNNLGMYATPKNNTSIRFFFSAV